MSQTLDPEKGGLLSPSTQGKHKRLIMGYDVKVVAITLTYVLFSSMMLICNKAAIRALPAPATLLGVQVGASCIIIKTLHMLGFLHAEPLTVSMVSRMWIVPASFLCLIFSNAKSLQYTNVETVIAFRTLTTFGVAYGDYRLYGGNFHRHALLGLAMIVFGAVGYMSADAEFRVDGYFWVSMYTLVMIGEPLLVKGVINSVNMGSWGRSYYNNALIFLPLCTIALVSGETTKLREMVDGGDADVAVAAASGVAGSMSIAFWWTVSCVMGTGISFVGFAFRESVDATSYTVTGNVNKLATITVNLLIWDAHATKTGIFFLLVALSGGILYTRAKGYRTAKDGGGGGGKDGGKDGGSDAAGAGK
jgi:hypothetical protein